MIIKIEPNDSGSHANQGTTPRIIPYGWIEVPPHLEYDFIASGAYCDLTIEDGILTGITPTERPEPEIPEVTPKQQIEELKKRLSSTDYKIIKCSEYQLMNLEVPYDLVLLHKERQDIRDQINTLESLYLI